MQEPRHPQEALVDLITDRCRELNITQTEAGRRIGFEKNRMSQYISGYRIFQVHHIKSLAEALALDPDEVYAAAGYIPPELAKQITTSGDTIKMARAAVRDAA